MIGECWNWVAAIYPGVNMAYTNIFYFIGTPPFFAKKKPILAPKLILTNLPQKYPFRSFNLLFSNYRGILEQNVWKQTPHNKVVVWEGLFYDILP